MNKWALIIGGSSGIGLASAQKLASEGFSIAIIHRDRRSVLENIERNFNELEKIAPKFIAMNFDATNEQKIDEHLLNLQDKFESDKIHLLLHSVSRGNVKPLISSEKSEMSEQDISLTINAMSTNLLVWVQKSKKMNLFASDARIIALTSEGNKKYWTGYGAVAMAKSALETMVKYLAVELASSNITINTIQAGVTDTPSLQLIPNYKELINGAKERNPNKRTTTAMDVANVVFLLSKEEAKWINGSTINVDGGEFII